MSSTGAALLTACIVAYNIVRDSGRVVVLVLFAAYMVREYDTLFGCAPVQAELISESLLQVVCAGRAYL